MCSDPKQIDETGNGTRCVSGRRQKFQNAATEEEHTIMERSAPSWDSTCDFSIDSGEHSFEVL
jgi:hypothetical protein